MKNKKKNLGKNRFLNFFWEPYKGAKQNLTRTLHFTKFYCLIFLAIEFFFMVVLLIWNNFDHATVSKLFGVQTLVIIFGSFLAFDTVFILTRLIMITRKSHDSDVTVSKVLGIDAKRAFEFGQLGIIVVDEDNAVVWMNDYLTNRQFNILDRNIYSSINGLDEIEKGKDVEVTYNNSTYRVHYLKDSKLFFFKDISEFSEEHENALNDSLVIGTIVFDTYDEVEKALDSRRFTNLIHTANLLIDKYFEKYDTFLIPSSSEDTIYAVCSYKNFEQMVLDKFSILNDVREISKREIIQITLSMGFAHTFGDTVPNLFDKSNKSVETALKRGGDQVIVLDGQAQQVYGGTQKVQRTQNLTRYRSFAQQLSFYARQVDKVVISGHKNSDMDSLAASVGLYCFINTVHKNDNSIPEARIVFDANNAQSNALSAFAALKKSGLKSAFITPNEAKTFIDENTLVIFGDVHNPSMTLLSKNFEVNDEDIITPKQLCIFDHHMKTTLDLDVDPIIECIDPSISSTAEIVTNLLEYTEEAPHITTTIANVLLAGIMLDTSYFKTRVDDATFYACNLLMQKGANHEGAMALMKDSFETYQLKCLLASNIAKPENYDNFYVDNGQHIFMVLAQDPKDDEFMIEKDMLAKVADDYVATKDVDAVFVIGKTSDNEIYVSARGNGKFNVQRICETAPQGFGGGEYDRAAISFKITDENALDIFKVKDIVKDTIMTNSEKNENQ